jgi:hypothetical protein
LSDMHAFSLAHKKTQGADAPCVIIIHQFLS